MMDQSLFNTVITERIMDYMPPIYEGYIPTIEKNNKVNETKDALMLLPEDKNAMAPAPMVYLDDMYELFREEEDLEEMLRFIANVFMNNIRRPLNIEAEGLDFNSCRDKVVMQLINTERNAQLLEKLPHKDVLDMSVIYRVMISIHEDGMESLLVNDSVMSEMQLDLRELNSLAMDNSRTILEPMVLSLDERAIMVSNKFHMFGSTAMLFDEVMDEVGEKLRTKSFYVLPCSIHEFIAVPTDGTNLEHMIEMLAEGNTEFTNERDILSNSIYVYDVDSQKIKKAASYR